jgi:hypothetical protein
MIIFHFSFDIWHLPLPEPIFFLSATRLAKAPPDVLSYRLFREVFASGVHGAKIKRSLQLQRYYG